MPVGLPVAVEPGAAAPVAVAPEALATTEASKPAGIAAPGIAAPGIVAPGIAAPETAAPEPVAPETAAPETAAPVEAAQLSAPIPEPGTDPATEAPAPATPSAQAVAPQAAVPAVAVAAPADIVPGPAEPVAAEPAVLSGEPATLQSPAATAEPQAPNGTEPAASGPVTLPPPPAIPVADKVQARQNAPERVPQPSVTDAAATLAKAAPAVESALPAVGTSVESPKPVLPGAVALPASDGPALTPAPAAKPDATQKTGDAPATRSPDLATNAAVQSEQAANIGSAATEPQQPGADPAPDSIADPAPPPAEPVAAEPTEPAAKPAEGVGASPETIPARQAKPGILALTDPGMPNAANAPKPGFATDAPGVRIIRPSATRPLPAARADAGAARQVADGLPALVRNAADFANPGGKPLMSVILIDDGSQDPARITGLGFPVTVALDPTRPGAADAAATYRAAGLEVLILATAVPAGATASDLEVTFQSHFNALPQAVGVLDLPLDGFQDNRVLAQQIVRILGDGGYGLVTIDKGLNPAAQVAERERLAQARVFRELDAAGENTAVIRRYLDRAAFRGAQQGSVVVLGHSTAETLQALVEWAAGGRAANMAMSPVSAAMSER